MSENSMITLEEAHEVFAKQSNGRVWELLGHSDRTEAANDEMVEAAFASLYHWRFAGDEVNWQRGLWLLAHVFTALKNGDRAVKYAKQCLEITESHPDKMADFDTAYAYEGMARALGLNGTLDEAKRYYKMAKASRHEITDPEDKEIFDGDFQSGDWFGVN